MAKACDWKIRKLENIYFTLRATNNVDVDSSLLVI